MNEPADPIATVTPLRPRRAQSSRWALLVAAAVALIAVIGGDAAPPKANGKAKSSTKEAEAQKFVDWVISPSGQGAIASYKIVGEQLFFPNAAAK